MRLNDGYPSVINKGRLARVVLWAAIVGSLLAWPTWLRAAEAPTPAGRAVTVDHPDTFLELLIAGGPVMIPIFICSVVAVAIAIERLISLRRRRIIPKGFMEGLIIAFGPQGNNIQAALAYCDRRPSPVSNIIKAGILRLGHRLEVVEKAVEDAAGREVARMRRGIEALGIVGTISPLLGLLGTIYGMIGAFRSAALMGLGRGEALAAGIYQALVTTAAGLSVAIPVLLIYYAFVGKVERMTDEIELIGTEFLEQCSEEPGEPIEAKIEEEEPGSRRRLPRRRDMGL